MHVNPINWMLLALTTLFHLTPLWIPHECFYTILDPYPMVVMTATGISFLWHLTNEEGPMLELLDLTFACIWVFLDILYAYTFHSVEELVQVIYLNLVVAIIYRVHEAIKIERTAYIYNYSIWHLLSATKCVAIAFLLRCN
jgi:hypothetical protein